MHAWWGKPEGKRPLGIIGRRRKDNIKMYPQEIGWVGVDWTSGVPRGGLGCSNPPRNSEDIGGVLDRMSKKNRHLDFLLQFTVFSYGCNLLNNGFF